MPASHDLLPMLVSYVNSLAAGSQQVARATFFKLIIRHASVDNVT